MTMRRYGVKELVLSTRSGVVGVVVAATEGRSVDVIVRSRRGGRGGGCGCRRGKDRDGTVELDNGVEGCESDLLLSRAIRSVSNKVEPEVGFLLCCPSEVVSLIVPNHVNSLPLLVH